MHMMDGAEEWRDPADAKVRRRKSDVQGKLYNFLNRSAQSLSRSNSQSGRTRRSKEKDRDRLEQLQTQTQTQGNDRDRDTPRASHAATATATSSRLPSLSSSTSNAPETSRARYDSSTTRTSRSAAITATISPDNIALAQPRKSSSPPLLRHKITVSSTPNSKTASIAYSYNTPPQTPSRSRKYSTPSSPTSVAGTRVGTELLLNRPLARPITPSNSNSGGGGTSNRKVLGIPIPLSLPSPNSRKTTLALEKENKQTQGAGSPRRQTHKLRAGSGSSNEPLLRHNRVPTNESERGLPRPNTSTSTSATSASTPRTNRTSDDRTPLPTPSSSLSHSHRSATPREEPPASPTAATSTSGTTRRGTPKLDFWRSVTSRAPSAQGDKEKGKQQPRSATPNTPRKDSSSSQQQQQQQEQQRPALITPQPRAFATFLPSIPHLQRIPPTPQKVEEQQHDSANNDHYNNRNRERDKNTQATIRLDSFMSDSLPIDPQTGTTLLKAPQGGEPSGLTRQPAFAPQPHNDLLPRTSRTPAPERSKTSAQSPGLGIQRSNSAPGTRGRLSPCLRIPSPKFLTREKSKERDRDREKEREKEKEKGVGMGMFREKRRVTPENVGAPILRDPRAHVHVHVHAPHSQVYVSGAEKGLKAPKTSLVQLRRAAHGTFDFERPGSRTSSKSGQSESHGTRSDDEKEKDKENEVQDSSNRRTPIARIITKSPEPIRNGKTPSPVPPLPTSRLNKPRSPPPTTRARSPLTATAGAAAAQSTTTHSHVHIDDSALPRLSSSLARRNSSSAQHHRTLAHPHAHARTPASLGHFSFEPAANAPSPPSSALKPPRNVGGQYIDTPGGLIMFAPTIQEEPVMMTKQRVEGVGGRRRTMSSSANVNHVNHVNHVAHVHMQTTSATTIPAKQLEEATAVIAQFKNALDDAGFATLQKYVRRYDASIIPLEGGAGLLSRVQRLLETSAPRVDERKKRQLYESFAKVVTQVS